MTTACPSALARSAYADGELPAADAAAFESHLAACDACRAQTALLAQERAALRHALAAMADEDAAPVPPLSLPFGRKDLLIGGGAIVAVAALAAQGWAAIDAGVPSFLRWLNPIDDGSLLDAFLRFVVFLTREGSAMWTSITEVAAAAVLVALLGAAAVSVAKHRGGGMLLASLLLVVLALPQLGQALEVRRNDGITSVAAGETIDDTLFAAGDTVTIEGTVNGDLFAFAENVTVRGNVAGDLFTAGNSVTIEGTVSGNVFGAGRSVSLGTESRVRGNAYLAGRDVGVAAGSEVTGNVVSAAATTRIAGAVGIDVVNASRELVVNGTVQRNVRSAGTTVTLLPPARVGGNVVAHVDAPSGVRVAPGATVAGTVDEQVNDRYGAPEEHANRYLTAGFYVRQMLWLAAAYVTGLLLFTVFPSLRSLTLPSGAAALRVAGLGLVAAVTVPAIVFLAFVTVIGIPVAILAGVLWAFSLYFAKAVIAEVIGRRLFAARGDAVPHVAATLLAGLVLVRIASNLPWVGWVVGLVITLLGLGLLTALVMRRADRAAA
jgi:cytoskeletal protein CcmA (bactofilin family)